MGGSFQVHCQRPEHLGLSVGSCLRSLCSHAAVVVGLLVCGLCVMCFIFGAIEPMPIILLIPRVATMKLEVTPSPPSPWQ